MYLLLILLKNNRTYVYNFYGIDTYMNLLIQSLNKANRQKKKKIEKLYLNMI